jgi:enoyl-CoA hydratase/carnithine racemase
MGLVNQVLPAAEFAGAVAAYARAMANSVSPRSMAVIKRQVYAGMTQTLGEALDLATAEMRASLQCEDFKEGVAHFVEKRAPAFTGR